MDRIAVLRQFGEALQSASLDDERLFHELVRKGIEHLTLSDDRFSREFGISRTSINRWKHGRNTPLARTRRQVYDFLKKETEEAIKTLEGLRRSEEDWKSSWSSSAPESMAAKGG
jgi:transcriptional regulator with XRE-family HTH domain